MRLHADFTKPAIVRFDANGWKPSPLPGVERFMLDRIGNEKARATSLVHYAPDSHFSAHTHDKGEEFLVLDGVFSDDSGDFGPGAYVRNPPGSEHAPWSKPGSVIFVKLRQFDPNDLKRVVVDTEKARWTDHGDGVEALELHSYGSEQVMMIRFAPGEGHYFSPEFGDGGGGLEVLVLEGAVQFGDDRLTRWDWLRLPPGSDAVLETADEGATLFIKGGHLDPMPVAEDL